MKGLSTLLTLWARKPPPVGTTPHDVVFAENKWRLLRYRGKRSKKTPLLLVPSLINRHYVLDLLPGKSLAGYLASEGHDVYCIDWGTPGDEDRYLTLDDIWHRYLGRAVRRTIQTSGAKQTHMLGYCMGGTMAVAYAAVHPEQIASLIALAAPIRFEDDGLLSRWSRTPTIDVRAIVDAFGNVPWPLMQSAFHLLRPTLNLSKLVHLVDRAWDDESLDGFLALETWGSDNVSFPGECYVRYIEELYRGDALIKGTFALEGYRARLEAVRAPTLTVTFAGDHIVPWQSAAVLHERIASQDKEHLHLKGGHVGAVVSRAASKGLWPKLSEWLSTRDALDEPEEEKRDVKRESKAEQKREEKRDMKREARRVRRVPAAARRATK
jgi:polyhydroxyalkanoate synthase